MGNAAAFSILGTNRRAGPELSDALLLSLEEASKCIPLSLREYEVLYLFGSGLGTSEIAKYLSLHVKTVSTYRARLLAKLKARTNAKLIRYAVKEGIAA